ncbi:thermonuclease family protein [Bacillus tianshenii]|nr:thermonuclease family protein [Bacillus tianshenii]
MKKFIYSLLLLLLLAVSGCSEEQNNTFEATVPYVVDGDTLDIRFNGKEERVRLLLVDTPETKHPDKPVQPFGPEASTFAKETLEGKTVEVELDVSERDKYGRLLAYIWVDDKLFNEMLIERGLARVAYVFEPNTKYVDSFYETQKEAQKEGIGIWSIENYAQEDGFHAEEQRQSTKQSDDCTIKGNINSKGDKIYHTEESPWYEQTKAEMIFCTEQEAQQAGFRAPQ